MKNKGFSKHLFRQRKINILATERYFRVQNYFKCKSVGLTDFSPKLST